MVNISFDTSALFYPEKLRHLSARPDVFLHGSTINVIETVSDVIDEDTFLKARAQMRLLLEVSGGRFLADTDTQFKIYLGLPTVIRDPLQWRQVAVWLAEAENVRELEFRDFDNARQMRRRHTEGWLDEVVETMLRSMNPRIQIAPDWRSKATAAEVEAVRHYLHSPAGIKQKLDVWFQRERWLPFLVGSELRSAASRVLSAYFQAHEGYLMHILGFNRKPEANDALDLDQALPLWQHDWVFISGDTRFLRCLELGGIDRSQFRAIGNLDPAEPLDTKP